MGVLLGQDDSRWQAAWTGSGRKSFAGRGRNRPGCRAALERRALGEGE